MILNKKQKEIRHQQHEMERLLDLYQSGTLEKHEIEERLKVIRSKIKQLQDECMLLDQEEKKKQQQLHLIEQFDDFKKRMNNNLPKLSFEDRKKLVRLLVSEVIVDVNKEELTVRHIVPINKSLPLCPWSNITATG
jgi:hypothetical protein